MILSLIAAASDNHVIGKDGGLPWHLPAEMKFFRETTTGKPVIMGRKTFASMGRALPKRRNIVISRDATLKIEGCDTVTTIQDAITVAKQDTSEEIFVIGGEEIYRLALPLADRIYLTHVHTIVEGGNAFFPEFHESEWKEIRREEHAVDAENAIAFTVVVMERR